MSRSKSTLATDLRALVTTSTIIDRPIDLETYGYDASFMTQLSPRAPDVAVIARCREDVSAVLRYANERGIPVTPRGAASGQAGGSVALHGGIVLSVHAMDRVIEIDTANMQVFVEPGVVHSRLNETLARDRLIFPPDPGSSRMATLGGMASTNAHGMRAVKYGPTASWVLGLEVVLANGDVIETGSIGSRAKQSSSGLDLTKLLVGSEGTLGVFTRLRLKAMPIPPARALVMGVFDVLENAGQAVQSVFAAGITASAIEIVDARSIKAINLYRPNLKLPDAEALLFFEVDGAPAGVRWEAEKIADTIRSRATRVDWSDEPKQMAALWEGRSVVGAAIGLLRPGSNRAYCGEDICVPVARIPETLREIQEISRRFDIPIATYGHIGNGNLHPGHLIDARDPDESRRVLLVADAIHDLALRMGGTTTGEHGVGAVRRPYMEREHGPALEAMRAIKRALDPNGILNPGKIFLTRRPQVT
ncbi:MAG: FAD-binding protein [Chloroflexota bacterium]|nr:MAG: FAD-binding protein [Chloroflexota bacterium]